MIKIVKTEKGATLLEILIAAGLFVIATQALLAICVQSMTMAKRGEYVYTAYNLAKNRLERLRALDFSTLDSAAETSTVINADGDADPDGAYSRTTTVTTSYTGNADLTQVTVSIYYTMKGVQSAQPMQVSGVFYDG